MAWTSSYKKKIQIYCDGADWDAMLKYAPDQRVHGFTTNPSLMKKAGVKDYKEFCLKILSHIKDKPISFEVFADEFGEMERQAREIKSWGKNVYVKIPVTNSLGAPSYQLIKKLSEEGTKLNVTAVFTHEQVNEVLKALSKSPVPSVLSIFAGRIADSGRDPAQIMKESVQLAAKISPKTEVLWASTRELFNLVQAEETGCHIITMPPEFIVKLDLINKDLADYSLDTVKMFKRDAESAGYSL